MSWETVEKAVPDALALAWDGCHKIYLAMDAEEVAKFESYGYREGGAQMWSGGSPEEAMGVLREWYADSCGLRFISAVRTDTENPNAGFTSLIAQGELAS